MYPDLSFLGVKPADHQVTLWLAVVVGGAFVWTSAAREGLRSGRVILAAGLITMFALAGGRLHYVLWHLDHFRTRPWTDVLSVRGLHTPGAVIGEVVGAPLVLWMLGLPIMRLLDVIAPAACVGVAISRIGCFLRGCCFGTTCDRPWCVAFPHDSPAFRHHVDLGLIPPDAVTSLAVHPLQLYFAFAALAVTGIVLWRRPHKRFDGEVALLGLFLFSLEVAVLEPLRDDRFLQLSVGSLRTAALILAVASGSLLASTIMRHRGRQDSAGDRPTSRRRFAG